MQANLAGLRSRLNLFICSTCSELLSNCTEIPSEIIKQCSYWFVFIYIHNSLLKSWAKAQKEKKKYEYYVKCLTSVNWENTSLI